MADTYDPIEPAQGPEPLAPMDLWSVRSDESLEPHEPAAIPSSCIDSLAAAELPPASPSDFGESQPRKEPARKSTAIAFASLPGVPEPPAGAVEEGLQEQVQRAAGEHVELLLREPEQPLGPRSPVIELPRRYRWLATLGEGGQGSVELVFDRDLGRTLALKTLLPHKSTERHIVELYKEARITGQLDHPHIITIYDAGLLPDGRLYYTMPRMPGESLHNVLVRLRRGKPETLRRWGLVPLVQALERACHAVGYAHSRGVIHRDIKPANILLGEHGEVLVVDWGIARLLGGPSPADTSSVRRLWSMPGDERQERVRGSPPYMAPEQVQHPDQVTAAADVFCFGVILYEALTRVLPWTGPNVETIVEALCHSRPVPPRERAPQLAIPPELEEICLRALEKFPGHRYADGMEMATALSEFLAGGRRREAARRRLREAGSMRQRMKDLDQQQHALETRRDEANVPPGVTGPLPSELAEIEEQLQSLKRAGEGLLSDTAWALHRALADDPDHPGIQAELAELYAERYTDAERRGADRELAWFRGLLRQLDRGRWSRWLRTGGALAVQTCPADREIEVCRLDVRPAGAFPGETVPRGEDGRWHVPPGRYALRLPAGDRASGGRWHYPLRVDRGDERFVLLDLRGEEQAGELFCFVPGGPALLGGDRLASGSGAERIERIPPFAIARHPVTVGAYLRFLDWVGESAAVHRPPDLDEQLESGERRPITGVTAADCAAYCRWMSEATGLTIRLPSADEWEKSMRGADGRSFPWGGTFAGTTCASSSLGLAGQRPPAVGSQAGDCSPFGVQDGAGGVWEWTGTELDGRRVVVGGSILSDEAACRSAARRALEPSGRLGFLGFRVLRELEEPLEQDPPPRRSPTPPEQSG